MKPVFLLTAGLLLTAVQSVEAQQDSVKVVIAGDSAIVIKGHPVHKRMAGQRMHIEREVTVDSDGDTTIVVNAVTGARRFSNRHRMYRHRRHDMHCGQGRHCDHGRYHDDDQSDKLGKMEAEARRMARELRRADAQTYNEKEELLRAHLEKIFDLKYTVTAESIEEKLSELEEQRKMLEARQSKKDLIIEDRISQLLGRGSLYHW